MPSPEDDYQNDKVNLFRKYYCSQEFLKNSWLPEYANQHHYRIEIFGKSERRVFRRVQKSIRTRKDLGRLTSFYRNLASIYFTPVRWLDPIYVRRSSGLIMDCMLSSPLYFDVDKTILKEKTYSSALRTTNEITEILDDRFHRKPDLIAFSGKNGFHVYYWNWDNIIREHDHPSERLYAFKKNRGEINKLLDSYGIITDSEVTRDPWRVLRLPGALHPETGLVTTVVRNIERFFPLEDCLAFDLRTYESVFALNPEDYRVG